MDLPTTCFDDAIWYTNLLLEFCKMTILDDQAKRKVRPRWSSEELHWRMKGIEDHLEVAQRSSWSSGFIKDIEALKIKMEI